MIVTSLQSLWPKIGEGKGRLTGEMSSATVLLADNNIHRGEHLKEALGKNGLVCQAILYPEQVDELAQGTLPRALFIAADISPSHVSDKLLRVFVRHAPKAPIIVISSTSLWGLITLAVRHRAWMDVPKNNTGTSRLGRYASARYPGPLIVVENDGVLIQELQALWKSEVHVNGDIRPTAIVHTVEDALGIALRDKARVILNIPGRAVGDTSTLIYMPCPAVIAALIESDTPQPSKQTYTLTKPASRFGLLRAPFAESDVRSLLDQTQLSDLQQASW